MNCGTCTECKIKSWVFGFLDFETMSPYRLQYNESESNIKNYNSLYKNNKKTKTLSKKKQKKQKISKIQNFQKSKILFCILYTFHNSYFSYFFILEDFEKLKIFKVVFCVMYTFHNSYFIIIIFYIYIYFYIFKYLYIFI